MNPRVRYCLKSRKDRSGLGYFLVFDPSKWSSFATITNSLTTAWREVRFNSAGKRSIPTASGIYAFCVRPKVGSHSDHVYLMYVGKADNLRRRYGDYLRERRNGSDRVEVVFFLNTYKRDLWFTYHRVPQAQLKDIEDAMISSIWPPANTAGKAYGTLEQEQTREAF